MAELEADHRYMIEDLLGRALTDDELHAATRLDALSAVQHAVARAIASKNGVLCAIYLRSITPATLGEAKVFIDEMCSGI